MAGVPADRWSSGDLYEPYVGRWSRLVARDFLGWLAATPALAWLDIGCGTGALTQAIATAAAPKRVAGIDPSAGFLDLARRRLEGLDVELQQAGATELPFGTAEFDYVASGLVLNFVLDQARAVREIMRVLRAGGIAALYVWDYAEGMQMMRLFWD